MNAIPRRKCRNLFHCSKVTAFVTALHGQPKVHCMACNDNDTAAGPNPLVAVVQELKSPNRSNNRANVLMLDLKIWGGAAAAGARQDVCCFVHQPPRPPSQRACCGFKPPRYLCVRAAGGSRPLSPSLAAPQKMSCLCTMSSGPLTTRGNPLQIYCGNA
jgi:hypothetical protein